MSSESVSIIARFHVTTYDNVIRQYAVNDKVQCRPVATRLLYVPTTKLLKSRLSGFAVVRVKHASAAPGFIIIYALLALTLIKCCMYGAV